MKRETLTSPRRFARRLKQHTNMAAKYVSYELELERELVPQGAVASQILTRRGLLRVPPGRLGIPASAIGLLRWNGMSVAARLRAMAEPCARASTRVVARAT